jgi:hypothetical protein
MVAQAITAENFFAATEEKFEEIVGRMRSDEAMHMNHSALEKLLETEGRELLRRVFENHLALRAGQERTRGREGTVVGEDGQERGEQRVRERRLMSVFGPVTVPRVGFSAAGNGSLFPLDAELNLPTEMYSHGVRRRSAEEAAKGSFDESVLALGATTGATVPKRQFEEQVKLAATDFEAFYAMREAQAVSTVMAPNKGYSVLPHLLGVAESGAVLVITTDAKGVVMRTADLREATRKAAEGRQHKLKRRMSKGEKRNAKRMAQVAAVYTIGRFCRTPEDIVRELAPVREAVQKRPRPEHKRVWASVAEEPEVVIRQAFEEAHARDPEHRKTWVALSDGNETQLRLLEELAREYGVPLTIVLDVIHVLEYLWKAAYVFHDEGTPEAEAWVGTRLLQVLRGKSSDVAAGIRRSATLRELRAADRKPADKCANYLLKYGLRLHYDSYLAKGLPIATGVIEGACRYLVKDRMDITGARWGLSGAEAVLRLRSLRASGDFNEYWTFHEKQEWERNHAARYADGYIPPLRPPASTNVPVAQVRLCVVK